MIDPAVANALPSGESFVVPAGHYTVPVSAAVTERLDARLVEFFHEQ